MTRQRRPQGDLIEQEIERVLNPGAFIPDDACFSFVSDLDEVASKIAKLAGSEPARAGALYETFLAACYMKIEELDDSSGRFGQFVDDLYCGWIEARQADGADPDETASRLLTWMDQDDYGFCYRLEMDAVKVFNKANLAAFVKLVRARFDAAAQSTAKKDGKLGERPDYIRRRWGEVLRTLYAAQKDVAAYVALAEETGLTATDCHAVAKLLVSKRKPEEALSWVERGFEVDKQSPYGSVASHDLAKLKRDLLTKLGRGDQALDAAWSDYREHPSAYTYDDLMKCVPKAQRKEWHEKAIEAAMEALTESETKTDKEAASSQVRETSAHTHASAESSEDEFGEHSAGARRADALRLLAEQYLAAEAERQPASAERFRVVVHVDAQALSEHADVCDGQCEIEEGPALALDTARFATRHEAIYLSDLHGNSETHRAGPLATDVT